MATDEILTVLFGLRVKPKFCCGHLGMRQGNLLIFKNRLLNLGFAGCLSFRLKPKLGGSQPQ